MIDKNAQLIPLLGLAMVLSGCIQAQAPLSCMNGTLVIKGTGPGVQPHLHTGRELYLLDFVNQIERHDDQAIANMQGRTVRVCGRMTFEPAPMPSRLRVQQLDLVPQQVQ